MMALRAAPSVRASAKARSSATSKAFPLALWVMETARLRNSSRSAISCCDGRAILLGKRLGCGPSSGHSSAVSSSAS